MDQWLVCGFQLRMPRYTFLCGKDIYGDGLLLFSSLVLIFLSALALHFMMCLRSLHDLVLDPSGSSALNTNLKGWLSPAYIDS